MLCQMLEVLIWPLCDKVPKHRRFGIALDYKGVEPFAALSSTATEWGLGAWIRALMCTEALVFNVIMLAVLGVCRAV